MPRRLTAALGLLALGLALALGQATRALAAEEAHHEAAARADAAHGAGAESSPNILEFRPSLALATLIVFIVLLLVLWRFAWGPLAKALHDREHHNEEVLRQTEAARAESERLLAEHRAQMAQAAEQVRAMLDEARRGAEASANDIVKKAQSDAEASRERARREIETARDQALMEIWTRSADMAVSVAGRVLERTLDESEQRRLVEIATNELPAEARGGRTA